MKKIIWLLIIISCFCGNAYAANNESYSEGMYFLTAEGIFEGYNDGTIKPNENVTRAEFTTIIERIQNLDEVGSADFTYYPDVKKDHWALQNINLATSQGLISGFADGTFRPDDNITIAEASKIIVSLLGYRPFAEANGGYPDGYLNVAISNDIMKGITSSYSSYATRDEISLMLYQALVVDMYEKDGDSYYVGTKTILSNMMKITKLSGVVTGTKYANTVSSDYIRDGEVIIDSVSYKTADPFLEELVGYKITFYVKEDDFGDLIITYYTVDENKNDAKLISAENINYDATTKSAISYYDENGKERSLKIDTNYIVLNGESKDLNDKSVFDIDDGNILCIDANNDGKYETVFVNSAKTLIVGRINKNDYIVTDKFKADNKINFDPSYHPDRMIVIRYNDKEIDFGGLKENDVVTYYESDSENRIVAYVSRDIVKGTVSNTESNGETSIVTIDNNEYEMSNTCINDLKNDQLKKNALTVGTEVELYIDVNGKIAAFSIQGSTKEKYAFLIMGYETDDGGSVQLKMWPEDGEVKDFETDKNLVIDDGESKTRYSVENIIPKLKRTRITESDDYIAQPLFQLIKYSLNSDGKIKTIKTSVFNDDASPIRKEGVFSRDFVASTFKTNKKDMINGAYKFDTDVKLFNIPPEHDKYSEYQRTVSFGKSVTADIALYDMDEHNFVKAALIINPDYETYYDNSAYKPLFVFDHMLTAVNSDDEVVYKAVGVYNKSIREFEFDKDPGFTRGDVYQILEVNEKVAKTTQIYDAELNKFARSAANADGYGMYGKPTDEVVMAFMYVRDITSSTVVLSDGENEMLLNVGSSVRCTIYDSARKEVRKSDFSEIQKDDKIVTRTYNSTAGDLVIIR